LFYDLGKTVINGIEHGKIGAKKGAELGLPVKDYTFHRLEGRIIIYADRLVDIIHDGMVELADEKQAETEFKNILKDNMSYGKNDITMARYYGYHDEIQALMAKP
jgi:uncharacterized protein